MLNILLMIILLIIIFIIIALYIGVKITFNYDKKGSKLNGCLKILVLKKIKVYSLEYPSQGESDGDEGEKRDIKKIIDLAKPCLEDIKLFLKKALKCIKITEIRNHLIFGLESYADTGKYIGIIWGALSIANAFDRNMHLSAEPSFNGSVVDFYGRGEIDINVLKLIPAAVTLISNEDVRTLIRGVLDDR